MPRDNGHNRYENGAGKYEQPNRYATTDATKETDAAPSTLPVPAAIQPSPNWQARRAPELAVYQPVLGDGYGQRSQARRFANNVALATQVTHATTQFYRSIQTLEQARQDVELAHERRVSVPAKAAQERMQLEKQLLQAAGELEAIRENQQTQRTDRARRRDLDDQDFQHAKLSRTAAIREQEARIAAAEAELGLAAAIGERRAQAELARVDVDALRNQADAEEERGRLLRERRKQRDVAEPAASDEMPEALAKHFTTERQVKRNVADAARRVQAIRDRATAQDRDLSVDEVEEIDMLENAATAAEESIRRGEASDIEV